MTHAPPLPDLSQFSDAEKDALIVAQPDQATPLAGWELPEAFATLRRRAAMDSSGIAHGLTSRGEHLIIA